MSSISRLRLKDDRAELWNEDLEEEEDEELVVDVVVPPKSHRRGTPHADCMLAVILLPYPNQRTNQPTNEGELSKRLEEVKITKERERERRDKSLKML